MACEGSDAGSDAGLPSYIQWELARNNMADLSRCFGGPIDPSCTGTVGQYTACIAAETTALISEINMFPACGMLVLADADRVFQAQSQASANPPAPCATLTNMCAGLTPPDPSQL
jgi:hypothetical protein